jgi:hypothetical protein
MSDFFQAIVDLDASEREAPESAARIREWLIAGGIIENRMTDCILGNDPGFPPGLNYIRATERTDPLLFQVRTNGLEIIVKREVFCSISGEQMLICSACSGRFEPPEGWHDAIDEWSQRKGPGLLACPACNAERPITEWQHDPAWGFGNLGFQFWNWPRLKTSFIEEVSARLGHRVVLTFGKL